MPTQLFLNVPIKHRAEIATLVLVQQCCVQRRQQPVVLLGDLVFAIDLTDLLHRSEHIQTAQCVVAGNFIAALHPTYGDECLVDVFQLVDEVLAHVDAELRITDGELQFDVHVEGACGLDDHVADCLRRIFVSSDAAFRRHRRVAVHVNQCKIGEAVFVLLRFDEEKNLLVVLIEQVIVRIDFVVVAWRNDDADVR